MKRITLPFRESGADLRVAPGDRRQFIKDKFFQCDLVRPAGEALRLTALAQDEEYLFEDARGLAEGNRVKIGKPEPLKASPAC